MLAPSHVTKVLIKADCRGLRLSHVKVEDMISKLPRPVFDAEREHARQAVSARVRSYIRVHQARRESLRLIVPWRARQNRGTDNLAVQAGHEQFPLGHKQHPAKVGFQSATTGRVQPAEAATVNDCRVRRLTQGVQIVVGKFL